MVEAKTITLGVLLTLIATGGIVFINFDSEKIYTCPTDGRYTQCESISGTGDTRCNFPPNEQGRSYTTCGAAWEKVTVDMQGCDLSYDEYKANINQIIYDLNVNKYKSYDDIMNDKTTLDVWTTCTLLLKPVNENITRLSEIRDDLLSRNIMPGEASYKNGKIIFPIYE